MSLPGTSLIVYQEQEMDELEGIGGTMMDDIACSNRGHPKDRDRLAEWHIYSL